MAGSVRAGAALGYAGGVEPLMLALDLLGVFAFALSGNLLASRKDIDIMGSLILGLAVGLGGGIMRDVILGRVPASLADPLYLVPPLISAALVYLLGQRAHRARVPIIVFDAVGLGVFVVTGTTIALEAGLPLPSAVVLGCLTGVGGGVLRDVLANEIPAIFNGSDIYLLPALLGAACTVGAWSQGWLGPLTALVIAAIVFAFRMVAWFFQWQVPSPMRGWSLRRRRRREPCGRSVFRRPSARLVRTVRARFRRRPASGGAE
ncbi:trimeric intracellular cation channel family protein [Brevibacterium salitolerans]|uniref:Trimeric intracellular cation channel family protein n=1 Tax=Brevibacterium salitolerans TaxID=1403566 RepID=A0ABN2X2B5_9MICO